MLEKDCVCIIDEDSNTIENEQFLTLFILQPSSSVLF